MSPVRRRIRERFVRPIAEFLHLESSSGVVLMSTAVLALIMANTPLRHAYEAFLHYEIAVSVGGASLVKDIHFWVNDLLMAVFFLLVGLEIKREIIVGELSSIKAASLPIAGAIGGMVVPAAIYAAVNYGGDGGRGWGVPMATDIAFSLGVLALLGPRVPLVLKVFLAALAIVDDLGAVLVIGLFYTSNFDPVQLGYALGIVGTLGALNFFGIRNLVPYLIAALPLWHFVYMSGLHPTIAGVLLALTIPARVKLDKAQFKERAIAALERFDAASAESRQPTLSEKQQTALGELQRVSAQVQMPLERIENSLHPWVSFLIVPIFAFCNAGLAIDMGDIAGLGAPIGLGVILGLVVGKPLGIVGMCYLAVKTGLAHLPPGVGWRQLAGTGLLAGIGFTMSLFIADLAFGPGQRLLEAKLAILAASLVAGIGGYLILFRAPRCRLKT